MRDGNSCRQCFIIFPNKISHPCGKGNLLQSFLSNAQTLVLQLACFLLFSRSIFVCQYLLNEDEKVCDSFVPEILFCYVKVHNLVHI